MAAMNIVDRRATVMTSREFNQDTAKAKRAAARGPVFITDRGSLSHVLLSKAEYDRLKGEPDREKKAPKNLAEALADNRPEADFDWEPPRLSGFSLKIPDLE